MNAHFLVASFFQIYNFLFFRFIATSFLKRVYNILLFYCKLYIFISKTKSTPKENSQSQKQQSKHQKNSSRETRKRMKEKLLRLSFSLFTLHSWDITFTTIPFLLLKIEAGGNKETKCSRDAVLVILAIVSVVLLLSDGLLFFTAKKYNSKKDTFLH